jgi:hypothetical protein
MDTKYVRNQQAFDRQYLSGVELYRHGGIQRRAALQRDFSHSEREPVRLAGSSRMSSKACAQ